MNKYTDPIIVNELEYRVDYSNAVLLDGKECRGTLTPSENKIEIANDLPQDSHDQTLWHELVHSIQLAFVLDIDDRTVDCLASGIYSIMKHNPKLIRFFMRNLQRMAKTAQGCNGKKQPKEVV